jgi:hypothetical protein
MPYKIHLLNREPPQPIKIAGILIETQIVPETPPLRVVETKEETKGAMRELMAHGILPGDLYAVGYDLPPIEQADAQRMIRAAVAVALARLDAMHHAMRAALDRA